MIWLGGKALLSTWKYLPAARHRTQAARLYELLRQGAHEDYVEQIRHRYDIHATVHWGFDTLFYGDGKIQVGEQTYFGRGSFIVAHPATTKIVIGAHCAISHNVHIRTQKHIKVFDFKQEYEMQPIGADIVIGNHVWIGANVFIVGGVTIGDNSIIGANSVVTHDIPPHAVYGGVPARMIRHKTDYLRREGSHD
jgi:maltose O-acetyltransferase